MCIRDRYTIGGGHSSGTVRCDETDGAIKEDRLGLDAMYVKRGKEALPRWAGSWPEATRRPDLHPKDRVVHYVHYVQKAQGGSELPVNLCVTFLMKKLSLIHISEPTRRTPISYAVFCLQ